MRREYAAAIAVGVLIPLAACGGGSSAGTSSSSSHQTNLADGETALLASQLTSVPGYRYVDVSETELKSELRLLAQRQKQVGAPMPTVSWHSVVAADPSQNTARAGPTFRETGFLQLFEYAFPTGISSTTDLSHQQSGYTGRAGISGTTVYMFTNPAAPNSKYVYLWVRHGVIASFDGATRQATAKWVRLYLAQPELQLTETAKLSSRLVTVPGFEYANFAQPALDRALADSPGSPSYSLHWVLESRKMLGSLILVDAPADFTSPRFVDILRRAGVGLAPAGTIRIDGKTVERFTASDRGDAYVYVHHGYAMALLAPSDRAGAHAFLKGFLGAAH